ncbi:patatin-like phospholipase family protein [Breoghania sp.]|uniref:patatin-like phospholipase family protein n=1 Tax=Breoghania sp. TaxID=2065378 RepID=UPI002AA681CE|nr:patatin-like phospholipase family protein [Breoghania sp.]
MTSPRIGLALGGGGARGLAHIPVLEALDEMGVKPVAIAGASIGAIMGGAYCGGLSGAEIREVTTSIFQKRSDALARIWKLRPRRFVDWFAGGGIAQFNASRVLEVFVGPQLPRDFADLKIPLTVVAADFYDCREVAIRSGDLHKAVAASIAIPVVFKPVTFEDRVMVDGGVVNPLPFDLLPDDLDVVIAVDVVGAPVPRKGRTIPTATDSVFGTTQILMRTITAQKLKASRPDILIKPDVDAFRVLNFLKADEILRTCEPVKEELRSKLEPLLEKLA